MGLNHNRSQYPSKENEIALVREAVERGVTLFDTAESYGYHVNEKLVGEALKGYTDRVFISSKFGHKFVNGVQVKTEEDSTPANIRRVCENSLRNLGVETLGMFYQHRIDPNTPIEVVAETVGELIKEVVRTKSAPLQPFKVNITSCTIQWKKTECWPFVMNWASVSYPTAP